MTEARAWYARLRQMLSTHASATAAPVAGRQLPRLGDRSIAGLVFLAALTAYTAGPAQFVSNDTRPAVFTAVSLVKRGDLDLDEFAGMLKGNAADWPYYVARTKDGGAVSRLGPGPAVLAFPVFAPVLWARGHISESNALRLGRLTAAGCVALAAALLFLTSRRLGARRRSALLATALYAFGTCAFSVASQALWQHGPAQLFLALGLFLFASGDRWQAPPAGAAFAAAVVCRPPDAVFGLAAAIYAVARWRNDPLRLAIFFLCAAPLALAQLIYNHHFFGAPWLFSQTQHVVGADALPDASYWANDPLVGFTGLLFSPSRGLFVYTPAFLVVAFGLFGTWRRQPVFLRLQLGGTVALILVLSRYYGWYGGMCFGYRMLADAAPALCLLAAPVCAAFTGWKRRLLLAAFAASIVVHGTGAYNYSAADWDATPDLDRNRERLWSVQDSQLRYVFTHRRHFLAP